MKAMAYAVGGLGVAAAAFLMFVGGSTRDFSLWATAAIVLIATVALALWLNGRDARAP